MPESQTYWRLTVEETPVDHGQQICVLYRSDGEAVVTVWGDEEAEGRTHDIVAWLPIPNVKDIKITYPDLP